MKGQLKSMIPSAKADPNSANSRVYAFIAENEPCTAGQIALGTNLTPKAVGNACSRLRERFLVSYADKKYGISKHSQVTAQPTAPTKFVPVPPTKHWTEETYIPPERLAAFSFPSIVNGKRVYPKGRDHG